MRLTNKKSFALLFEQGQRIKSGPVQLVFLEDPHHQEPVKLGITAPKKRYKKAVTRNRIKRQVRAIFRTENKPVIDWVKTQGLNLSLMVIYHGPEVVDYQDLRDKIILSLQRLLNELENAQT